jgi:hypothetical protein
MNYWLQEENKPDADWDVVSDTELEGTEQHNPLFLNNKVVCETYCTNHTVASPSGVALSVVSMEGLAIIKRSHLWRALSFDKHILHYHRKGLSRYFVDNQLYQQRLALSYEAFKQWKPNLNKSVSDFFDDAVVKTYNHDWLHEVVAYYDKPLYTKLQKDSTKAWCDKDLWYNLAFEDKIKCVAEETKVIAIERFLVPRGWVIVSRIAYMKALEKVCTTLCSGWFRDFAIDNYPLIVAEYNAADFEGYKRHILTNPVCSV